MDKEKCIDVCNSLLRGEISASETYEQALEKFAGEPEARTLEKILQEHRQSAQALKEDIIRMGGTPSKDSGAWGTFAKSVQGSAKLLGENAAVTALKKGEEHGRNDYEDALKKDDVLPECKDMIRNTLLPRQLKHISTLESLPT